MPTPELHHLPPLPKTIRTLTNDEARALDARQPGQRTSVEDCVTCHGQKTFRWYTIAPGGGGYGDPVTYECPCVDQYLLFRWMSHQGIQKSYQRLGWGDVFTDIDPEPLTQIADYADNRESYIDAGISIVLTGPKGNGKTMLANLLLKRLIEFGVGVYATTFNDMIDLFAGGWQDREQSRWFERTVRNAGVLFIDDLGRERNTGPGSVGENMLETVVRSRVGGNQPVVITTNLSEEDIRKGYGGHLISLLSERSLIIPVTGADRRGTIRQRTLDEVRQHLTRPVVLG